MDDKQTIAAAKAFVRAVYAEEGVKSLRMEEFEYLLGAGDWVNAQLCPKLGVATLLRRRA